MKSRHALPACLVLSLFSLPACIDVEPEVGSEAAALWNPDVCPWVGCQQNGLLSYNTGGIFHFQLGSTERNPEGFRLESFQSADGRDLQLVVEKAEIIGVSSSGTRVRGGRLHGAKLRFSHWMRGTSVTYHTLTLADHAEQLTHWVGAETTVPSYFMLYSGPNGRTAPVCADDNGPHHLIAFTHSKVNYKTGKITQGRNAKSWVNLSCTGSALTKAYLARALRGAATRAYPAPTGKANAMTNAWTMRACPGKKTFTNPGKRVWIEAAQNWHFQSFLGRGEDEAIWDKDGVVCLNWHRLQENDAVMDAMYDHCGEIEQCTEEQLRNWEDWGDYVTWNGDYVIEL